jgi:hypothetical protein
MTVHSEAKVRLPLAFEMDKKGADYRRYRFCEAATVSIKDSCSSRTEKD